MNRFQWLPGHAGALSREESAPFFDEERWLMTQSGETTPGFAGQSGSSTHRATTGRRNVGGDDDRQHRRLLALSDVNAVREFMLDQLRLLQQNACKIMAKGLIKMVEPKKQTNHPYTKGDESAPPWWPTTTFGPGRDDYVLHREPDHLKKRQRVHLLADMLWKVIIRHPTIMRESPIIYRMRERAEDDLAAWFLASPNNQAKRQYLWELFNVAERMEQVHAGRLDPNTHVSVPASPNMPRDDDDDDDDSVGVSIGTMELDPAPASPHGSSYMAAAPPPPPPTSTPLAAMAPGPTPPSSSPSSSLASPATYFQATTTTPGAPDYHSMYSAQASSWHAHQHHHHHQQQQQQQQQQGSPTASQYAFQAATAPGGHYQLPMPHVHQGYMEQGAYGALPAMSMAGRTAYPHGAYGGYGQAESVKVEI